jgi:hypothetical protein
MVSFQVQPEEKTKEPMRASERAEATEPFMVRGQCCLKMRKKIETATAPRRAAKSWKESTGLIPRVEQKKAERSPRMGRSET